MKLSSSPIGGIGKALRSVMRHAGTPRRIPAEALPATPPLPQAALHEQGRLLGHGPGRRLEVALIFGQPERSC